MAFNGSGTFVRLYNWVNDAAANIKIRADRMDNEMNGMATALSTCITKDGQTTVTANLPMAGFRHTGTGAGASRTDYTRLDQAQDGKLAWVDGGGTADAITASYAIPITTLVDGQLCYVRATAANATTTPTFSPSALTARTIVKQGGAALAPGDIAGDGHELIFRYDLANTRWELLNPKATTVPFTAASASGPASLDFAEDTDNGTNKITLSAPAALAADRAVSFPDAAGEVVLSTATQTLTNKTLTAPKIANAGFIADANGNELIIATTTASAVNEITVANAATTGKPTISATGGDTNIILSLEGKGTGGVQIEGTTTNDNAAAGSVGEVIEATAGPTSITTATAKTIASITLTAGDWDVWGNMIFTPAATTSITQYGTSISATTNTFDGSNSGGAGALVVTPAVVPGTQILIQNGGKKRVSIAAGATYYLVALGVFTVSTMTASGYIAARRVR